MRTALASPRQGLVVVLMTLVLVVGVATYGLIMGNAFTVSLAPELENRARLIGETLRGELERALGLRIPLERLAGVTEYLDTYLAEFPELTYVTIRDQLGAPLYVVGEVPDQRAGTLVVGGEDHLEAGVSLVHAFPLEVANAAAGAVELGVDRNFIRARLSETVWDLLVILAVALVAAFELTLAVGRRIGRRSGTSIAVGDVRLALFVFAVGEELNKSFLPMFIGDLRNPPGLDANVAMTLPIVSYLLMLALMSPFAGRMAGRIGTRNLFLLGVIPAAASHLGMAFATELAQVFLLRAVTGLGYALVTIACQEYLLDTAERGSRARSIGVFVSVVIGGTFAGTALGGIFADSFGYDAVFFIAMALVAASGLLAAGMMSGAGSGGVRTPTVLSFGRYGAVLSNPSLLTLLVGVTIPMNVIMAAFLWYLVPLQLAGAGATAAVIARVVMVYYLIIWLGSPLLSALGDRRRDRWLLVGAGSLVPSLALLLPTASPSQLMISLAVLVVGVGHAAVRGPQVALAIDLAERSMPSSGRGAVLAAMRSLERLGSLIGLVVVGIIAGRVGLQAAELVVAAACGVVAVGFLVAGLFLRPAREEVAL